MVWILVQPLERKTYWDKMIWLSPLGENGFLWAIKIDLFVLSAGNISYYISVSSKIPQNGLDKEGNTMYSLHMA